MRADHLPLRKVVVSLRSHRWLVALIVVGCAAVATALAYALPKRYKSHFVLTIHAQYFQNPLVRDFMSEVQDPSELRAQRESLIRQSFDDALLDKLGEKYGLYRHPASDPRRSLDRDQLMKRIEILPLNSMTFKVSFFGRTAIEAMEVSNELLAGVTYALFAGRRQTLTNLRNSVRSQMDSMGLSVAKMADPMGSVSASALKAELARLDLEIAVKLRQFTPRHPDVVRLYARAEQIRKTLSDPAQPPIPGDGLAPGRLGSASERAPIGAEIASLDVYRDLLKKSHYLSVAIDMEDERHITSFAVLERPQLPPGPLFPRKSLFAICGVLAGLLLSSALLRYQGARHAEAPALSMLTASRLGTVNLGELPALAWREDVPPVRRSVDPSPRRVPTDGDRPRSVGGEWN